VINNPDQSSRLDWEPPRTPAGRIDFYEISLRDNNASCLTSTILPGRNLSYVMATPRCTSHNPFQLAVRAINVEQHPQLNGADAAEGHARLQIHERVRSGSKCLHSGQATELIEAKGRLAHVSRLSGRLLVVARRRLNHQMHRQVVLDVVHLKGVRVLHNFAGKNEHELLGLRLELLCNQNFELWGENGVIVVIIMCPWSSFPFQLNVRSHASASIYVC